MGNIFVVHNTIKYDAVFEDTTWNFLNLSISFDVDLNVVLRVLGIDGSHGFDSEINDKTSPLAGELGSNSTVDDLMKVLIILQVNWFL